MQRRQFIPQGAMSDKLVSAFTGYLLIHPIPGVLSRETMSFHLLITFNTSSKDLAKKRQGHPRHHSSSETSFCSKR
ncbi:MAG: hypothetical protein PHP44_10070, partial [Kiritimatiellae bacterium]|nr:hypothetical protein [Kiritimatiellia bacterium]